MRGLLLSKVQTIVSFLSNLCMVFVMHCTLYTWSFTLRTGNFSCILEVTAPNLFTPRLELNCGIRSPDRPACSESLYRLSYPGPRDVRYGIKPTNAHTFMKLYYTHCISATCFGHSYGHLQGGALQGVHTSKYYRSFWKQCTDIKY
jgi:hypothetical protein